METLDTVMYDTDEDFVSAMLPVAAALDADAWRTFLAVCEEEGISLQKLGRKTGLSQSALIRATSVLESWLDDGMAETGLLRTATDTERYFRRNSFLTPSGVHLHELLLRRLGSERYVEQALDVHRYFQHIIDEYSKVAA